MLQLNGVPSKKVKPECWDEAREKSFIFKTETAADIHRRIIALIAEKYLQSFILHSVELCNRINELCIFLHGLFFYRGNLRFNKIYFARKLSIRLRPLRPNDRKTQFRARGLLKEPYEWFPNVPIRLSLSYRSLSSH